MGLIWFDHHKASGPQLGNTAKIYHMRARRDSGGERTRENALIDDLLRINELTAFATLADFTEWEQREC